jgi:phage shock protein PspC (stress-responsive transcriptional regulator)
MSARLYRSRINSKIGGVCGGIAEYFDIDPVIPRIVVVVLTLVKGIGLIAYLIAWMVIPKMPLGEKEPEIVVDSEKAGFWSSVWPGVILVGLGGIFLIHNFFWWFDFDEYFWPLLLIVVGGFLIFNSTRKKENNQEVVVDAEEVK